MTEEEFTAQWNILKERLAGAEEAILDAKSTRYKAAEALNTFTKECPSTTGPKFKGATPYFGEGFPTTTTYYFRCSLCERLHRISEEAFDRMPGDFVWLNRDN